MNILSGYLAAATLLISVLPAHSQRAEKFEKEKEFRENPLGRLEYEFSRLRDPAVNEIPPDIARKELNFARRLQAESMAKGKDRIQSLQWENVGPDDPGGRTRALALDIANEKNILAGAVSGGMWRSIDGGQSWVKTTAPNELQSVTCIAQDKRAGKRNIWYYGTGELLSTNDRKVTTLTRTLSTGNGIFKSTDNGASWSPLASTRGGAEGILTENFQGVWQIATDNSNPGEDEVYAACYGGIMRSTNGGADWTLALGDQQKKPFSSYVEVLPSGLVYAALSSAADGSATSKQGFWRSADGINWVNITPPSFPGEVRTVLLAPAPSDPNIVYFLTESPFRLTNGQIPDWTMSRHRLWRYTYLSGDGSAAGGKWEELTQNLPGGGMGEIGPDSTLNSIGGYALTISVKPDDPDFVLIGAANLYRSTDGFSSSMNRDRIGGYPHQWRPGQLHPDIHAVVFSHTDPDIVFAGSDGGVSGTNAIRADSVIWEGLNGGYITTQFYSVALDPGQSGDRFVMGGLQDNGTMAYQWPADGWYIVFGGDGLHSEVIPGKDIMIASIYNGTIWNVNYNSTGILEGPLPGTGNSRDFNFYTVFEVDRRSYAKLYMPARNRLFRHDNLQNLSQISYSEDTYFETPPDPNWSEMKMVSDEIPAGHSITALSTSATSDLLFIGTDSGRVYRVDDAATNLAFVTEITAEEFPRGGFVSCIDVDEENPDRIIVVFSNYNVRSIFLSENGGATWEAVGGNLDASPDAGSAGPSIRWIKSMKQGNGRIYFAATSIGLFSTGEFAGSNTEWVQEGATTIGNVLVEMVDTRSSDGMVAVATYGSGIYQGRLTSAVDEASQERRISLEQCYPNPVSERCEIGFRLSAPMHASLKLYNALGEEIALLAEGEFPAGRSALDLSFSGEKRLSSGTYFYRLEAGKQSATQILKIER